MVVGVTTGRHLALYLPRQHHRAVGLHVFSVLDRKIWFFQSRRVEGKTRPHRVTATVDVK